MEETEEKKKEKDTEKKEKKTKKKSKDSVDAPKTNKTTKQERKSNKTNSHFHSKSFASNKKKPTSIKLKELHIKLYANVCSFTEKNLQEALTSEAVSAEVSPEKTKQDQSEAEQEEEEEEEDGLQRNASQTPERKKDLDTCERKICSA